MEENCQPFYYKIIKILFLQPKLFLGFRIRHIILENKCEKIYNAELNLKGYALMIRYAKVGDSRVVRNIVNLYASQGQMLQVSLNEVFERLYEFAVWDEDGEIVGVCALHPMWEDVAEIRSLAVIPEYARKGIGKKLVDFMLKRAAELGFKKVFALTYRQDFFEKCGFVETTIESLPKKIWTDCMKCVKYPDCDEVAVIRNVD